MSFEKGHKLSPGRKRGSVNKKTREWEELGEYLIAEGAKRVVEIMQNSPPKEFIVYYDRFLNYFKPQLSRKQVDIDQKDITPIVFVPYEEIESSKDDSLPEKL